MIKRPHESWLGKDFPAANQMLDQGSSDAAGTDRRHFMKQMVGLGGAGLLGTGLFLARSSLGQDDTASANDPENSLLSYVDPKTSRYRCGLMLDTGRSTCRGVIATFPLLREWPEQKLTLASKEIDPAFSRWTERELGDGLVNQFVTQVPMLRPGTIANALFTYEVTRTRIIGPIAEDGANVSELEPPQRASNELRQFLQSSPYIDPSSARIRMAVREIEALGGTTAWGKVEQAYDWVREKINYVDGEIKSADEALKDGTGDCEELTSAFIAICRAMRIPARMVYVLRHCYPEFYLEDAKGAGTWFPCQAAGTRQFGSMEEYRPILQKGDRFKVPDQGLERYVPELFKAKAVAGGEPLPRFVQEELD